MYFYSMVYNWRESDFFEFILLILCITWHSVCTLVILNTCITGVTWVTSSVVSSFLYPTSFCWPISLYRKYCPIGSPAAWPRPRPSLAPASGIRSYLITRPSANVAVTVHFDTRPPPGLTITITLARQHYKPGQCGDMELSCLSAAD